MFIKETDKTPRLVISLQANGRKIEIWVQEAKKYQIKMISHSEITTRWINIDKGIEIWMESCPLNHMDIEGTFHVRNVYSSDSIAIWCW